MSITGAWKVQISTPIGKQSVVLELSERDGMVEGQARGDKETVPLLDPILDGNNLSWKQAITRPMRLNLAFDVTIEGDRLVGTSKAGKLPTSKVVGNRMVDL